MKRKITFCMILMLLTAFLPFTNVVSENNSNEYVLESYHIDMVVNENNTFNITEKIVANFKVDKHGIIRKIPTRNTVTRLDVTTSRISARITEVNVNEPFKEYFDNGFKVIKIGEASYTLTGTMDYTISYLYNLGRDTGKDYDELYFNLIGDQWDTTIDNVTFSIRMPKEFDPLKLGFSYGKKGSVNSSDISYSVSGNVITGRFNGRLKPAEALTVRLELPEGYFVNTGLGIDLLSMTAIILSTLFALISFSLWLKYGKDDKAVETVEFYPPGNFNSADLGFFYKGFSERKDVISLLINLANKGYLNIVEEDNDRTWFSKGQGFRLIKIREYDSDNEIERIFLNGLFGNRKQATYKDLYNKFYKTLGIIEKRYQKQKYTHMIFEKKALDKGNKMYLMIVAVFCLITIRPAWEYQGLVGLLVAFTFIGIGFAVLVKSLVNTKSSSAKALLFSWALIFAGVPWVMTVLPGLLLDTTYLVTYIIGSISIICMMILLKNMPKRTPFGIDILGKTRGFKTFLKVAEKSQLEALVMKEPSYFFDILPYTYVLGVSDKWIKKFEFIALSKPDWYTSNSSFSNSSFKSFTDKTMLSVSRAMSSSPSSGGGSGSSSGGGSSGGGSGGGGGSSW